MRILHFCKYHGAGNDFVLIDNRSGNNALSNEEVALLCHRQLGIGGDGLMMLGKSDNADFEMIYYNSDGHQASMCGNGGRCIVAFAKHLNIIDKRTTFEAYDGLHSAEIIEWNNNCGVVKLGMEISTDIEECLKGWKIDTGSPHYIEFINSDIIKYDVVNNGRRLRYDKAFQPQGTNVDFISKINDTKAHNFFHFFKSCRQISNLCLFKQNIIFSFLSTFSLFGREEILQPFDNINT